MSDLRVFEAGMRNPAGTYAKFMESPDREKVEEYLEIMKTTMPEDFEMILMEKQYVLVTTTPNIVWSIKK